MPLYEYRCGKCRKLTEVIQSFSEKPLRICPHCGARALKKLMSAPAIQFKGSGWYVTDYAGKTGESREPASGSPDKAESKDSKKEPKSDRADKKEKSEKAEKAEKADKAARKSSRKD